MEQTLRHQHDLLFIRLAITRHRLLDLDRRIPKTGTPSFSAASRITPRPWATEIPVVILVLKNNSSIAISSG